jgi:hypothetical protein
MSIVTVIVMSLILYTPVAISAQPRQSRGSFELSLRAEGVSASPHASIEELRLLPRQFRELSRRNRHEPPAKQRHREYTEAQWLLSAVDKDGTEGYWLLIPDPRLVRAEFPPPGETHGELSGEILIMDDVDFLASLPQDDRLVELRILQPHWTGQEWGLTELGRISLKVGGK